MSSAEQLSDEIRKSIVLELKQRALSAKKGGQTQEALAALKQAKDWEAKSKEDLENNPYYLKKIAVALKQAGDLQGAKEALVKAKTVQAEAPVENSNANHQSTPSSTGDNVVVPQDGESAKDEEKSLTDDDVLNGLQQDAGTETLAYTDEEMMDEEMMTEFALGGMDVPSQQTFTEKVLKYKKAALKFKQDGNIPQATEQLSKAKQFQKVQNALLHMEEGLGLRVNEDDDGWIETLNAEESELLGELVGSNSASSDRDLLGMEGTTGTQQKLDLKDLESMDDSDVQELLDMGMDLPSVDELVQKAAQKQSEALKFKQAGSLDMAKFMLVESKQIKAQADRLEKIYSRKNQGISEEFGEDDLEALLAGSDKKESPKKKVEPKKEQDPWMTKPAEEIKQQVLKLKDEKNVPEATRLLRIYKLVLKREADAAEAAKRLELTQRIQSEIEIAIQQVRLFSFFQHFVDEALGNEQMVRWKEYITECEHSKKVIQSEGSGALAICQSKTKLKTLNDDVVGLVERGVGSTLEGRLEVSVVECIGVKENKTMQKILKKHKDRFEKTCPRIYVDLKLQLPLTDESQSLDYTFHPLMSKSIEQNGSFQYLFPKKPEYVNIPRGDSRQAKMIIRRLETKRVQLSVFCDPSEEKAKSWFWGRDGKKKEDGPDTATLIGKVTLDLSALLSRNCIVGDFPLILNSKEVGGVVRLCLRTDQPIDPTRFSGEPIESSIQKLMTLHESTLSFAKNQPQKE